MVADGGEVRKQARLSLNWNGLMFRGPRQINFKIHEAMTLFDGYDFRHVQTSGIQEIELTSKIKIEEPLHGAVGRDNASLHAGVVQAFLHFHPFLIVSDFRSPKRNGKPSNGYVIRSRMGDDIGRFV